ncbi:hypothetical protein [Cellulomonas uda]|uniref:hypothetical protein n=1 Tax=Cellulomonas uda TaxID=1714 RepID=UPI001142EFBC|nr:hypothetical protein [Cellulomonas uda]NII66884.1 hypothetical protein [Cellulomonas uda]
MIPIKTSVDDMQRVLGYMSRQIGWVEVSKAEKALGSVDERKIAAMVEFGLILRDGANIKLAPRGQTFVAGDQAAALREVITSIDLYRATVEWVHYGSKSEATAAEIGQYWESSHSDTLGNLQGSTLKDGAVCFGRVVEGAGLGTFTVGRGGKETRIAFNLTEVAEIVTGPSARGTTPSTQEDPDPTPETDPVQAGIAKSPAPMTPTPTQPTVSVSTSPNVHVNVEIHIAADATADTVREIFRNMAYYILDKPVDENDR